MDETQVSQAIVDFQQALLDFESFEQPRKTITVEELRYITPYFFDKMCDGLGIKKMDWCVKFSGIQHKRIMHDMDELRKRLNELGVEATSMSNRSCEK